MIWKMTGGGGGPWGGGGSGGGNGGPGNNNPWGRPSGGDKRPPDIDEMLRKGQDKMKSMMPGGFGSGKGAALIAVLAIIGWVFTGFYRVEPDEQGVVLTFGKFTSTTTPGLNWIWPTPIQSVLKPSVTKDNYLTVTGRNGQAGDNLMLTGDENIVNIDFNILWRIKDAPKYLFTARDPNSLISSASESVVREIIGQTPIQSALTEGRGRIETTARDQIQALVDSYGIGVEIRQVQLSRVDPPGPVVDAFNEVQRARSDRERSRNEAEAYRNDIIPRARGEAERMLQEAQAYREEIVNRAQGDAQRFLSIYETYKVSKDVTTQRLYIETMEEILARSQKIVIEPGAAGQGVLPYLPLPELRKPASPAQGVR